MNIPQLNTPVSRPNQSTCAGVLHAIAKLTPHLLEYFEQVSFERPVREHSSQILTPKHQTREFTQQTELLPHGTFFQHLVRPIFRIYIILFFQRECPQPSLINLSIQTQKHAARNAPFRRPGVDFDRVLASSSDVTA